MSLNTPMPPTRKNHNQSALPDAQYTAAEQTADELGSLMKQLGLKFVVCNENSNNISGTFNNITELFKTPEFIYRLNQDIYASDKDKKTWYKLTVRKGKIIDITYLITFTFNWIKIYNKTSSGFDYIVISYKPGIGNVPVATSVIPRNKYTPERIMSCFTQLKGQSATESKEIGKLLLYFISEKVSSPPPNSLEYVSNRQGFKRSNDCKTRFNPSPLLCGEILEYLPVSVTSRQYPVSGDLSTADITSILKPLFLEQKALQLLLLFRIASWHQSFFAEKNIYADNVLIVKPAAMASRNLPVALLKNTRYDSLDAPPIGPNIKPLKFDLETINDGMVVVVDVFAADQIKKAEKGYDLVINDTSGAGGNDEAVHHITVLISQYADLYIQKDRRCVLEFGDTTVDYSVETYKNSLMRLDKNLILRTECGCNNDSFIKSFSGYVDEIRKCIPDTIPYSKHNTYIILMTALRIYNAWYTPLFCPDIEQYIEEWLSSQEHERQPLYDVICSEYGKILNQIIADGYFRLILKEEVTPFDKGSRTIVVDKDERRLYVETADSFAIAHDKMMSVTDTDSLTAALYSCGYLPHNAKSEKSVRIAAITSDGTPYPLYVHAISYTLLTQENRQRFELIDKEPFLFNYDEIPEGFLPLVKTIDGRVAGKMLRYAAEENNIYFGTGRTGSGKSWAVAQLMPMLFMLRHTVVVFDVSNSYSREKLLKMLPTEVVEKLFKFINVGAGKDPVPVDLGSLRGCESLPDKKRAIYSVLRAATGSIDKSTSRNLKGFLSEYLKNKSYSVSFSNLCFELNKNPNFGTEVADRIYSVFTDIGEIGYEQKTWNDLFSQEHKIIVINLGNEVGDSTHQLLDIMVGSLFNWQMSHDKDFLSIVIDELIDQDFSTGSPLQTVVKQGRKFHTALVGATQDYYNQGSSYLDVMKQANIKSFCRPSKSEDRMAQQLGYSNATDAGFNKFKAGDTILEFDGYNKETDGNEAITLKGRVVNFIESPLYEKFKEIYGC